MRPSEALALHREEVLEAVGRFRTANPRVFGSVLHGTDREGIDLDLLVDALPVATLLDLGGLQEELESLLGVRVDVRTPGDLPAKFRGKCLRRRSRCRRRFLWEWGGSTGEEGGFFLAALFSKKFP